MNEKLQKSDNINLYKYKAFCGPNSFTGTYRYLVFGFESRSSFNVYEVKVYPTTSENLSNKTFYNNFEFIFP